MSDKKMVAIYGRALRSACKFIRQNCPGSFDNYPEDMLPILCGGLRRDPDGEEYVQYYLAKAIMEVYSGQNIQ